MLALVRHPTPSGHEGLCYGHADLGLAASAPAEIERIVTALRPLGIASVWSSPSRRACVAAAAIAKHCGCPVPLCDERLREMNFGEWEGVRWDAIERAALDAWAADPLDFAPPSGESCAQLIERVRDVFAAMANARGPLCVVTHGGPLKILCALAAGTAVDLLAPPPAFASVTICTLVTPCVLDRSI